MDFEDAQQDVAIANDAAKQLIRHLCGTASTQLEQQFAMLDRRLRRVSRRYTRLIKSKHRDPRLEDYECCVDDMTDWLDQSECSVKEEFVFSDLGGVRNEVLRYEVRNINVLQCT